MELATSQQKVMESRYVLPYNWTRKPSSRHWRQKNGLWTIAQSLAGDLKGKAVLDAGCGDGWYAARMSEAGAVVHGTDYSEKAIEFAKLIVPQATFKTGSLLSLPYEDESFEVVFSFQVLEHIEPADLPQAVAEVARILKPGGLFIPSVPTVRRPMSTAHFQHFTEASITAALEGQFVVKQVVGQECYTIMLKVIERILENRYWLLTKLAELFHRGTYLRRWNRGPASRGYNFVVQSQKK